MLFLRIFVNAFFQHDPAIKPEIGTLLRVGIGQIDIILFCLIHRVNRIAGPLIVCDDLAGDHIGFSAVCLQCVYIAHHLLKQSSNLADRLR